MFTINQNLIDDFADKINEKEKKNNKVTSLSSSSTHVQYPSAKAVYDAISEVEASSGGNYIYDFYHDSSTDDIVLEYDSASGGSGGNGGSCVTDFYIDSNTDEWVIETSACSQGEVVTQWEQTLSDEKVPSEKLVKNTIDGLSIPTKTSDLTNDGDDGVNPFVSDDDSRLSDARTPTTHTHDDRYYTESEINSWTSQTVGTYGTLYVNTALRLCEFKYFRANYKFNNTSEVTLHSGAIPSAYRPKQTIICSVYQVTIIGAVTTSGDIVSTTSASGTKTINMTAFWHY